MSKNSKPKISQRQKQSTWIILLAIAIMSGATYWIVKRNYHSPAEEYQAPDFSEKRISLAAYYKQSSEVYKSGSPHSSDQLIFKVNTTFPAYVALYELNQFNKANIIFSGTRVPPGKDRVISRGSEKFVYSLKPAANIKKICLLSADSADRLDLLLAKISSGHDLPPATHCVDL